MKKKSLYLILELDSRGGFLFIYLFLFLFVSIYFSFCFFVSVNDPIKCSRARQFKKMLSFC